jgi:hypothetical protein
MKSMKHKINPTGKFRIKTPSVYLFDKYLMHLWGIYRQEQRDQLMIRIQNYETNKRDS